MIKLFDRNFAEVRNISSVLKSIYGLNFNYIIRICGYMGISPLNILKNIPAIKLKLLEVFVSNNFLIERPLKRLYLSNIDQKIKKGVYSGLRLRQGLPSRGQRTHTNAKTSKKIKIN